jgi:predicted amidohydrolase
MSTDSTSLRLGLLQYAVTRINSFEHYAQRFDTLVAAGAAGADLLLMPEYACMEIASALTSKPDPMAELDAVCAHSDKILDIFRASARRHGVWLQPGTLPFRDADGQVHNRAPLITPTGDVAFQDKHVMTRFETESWGVRSGLPPAVFETPWGRIGIAICYDSEFPPLVRAQVEANAWLILVPTCTDTLHGFNRVRLSARARALENQCFVAVAPTVGDAPWLATLDANRGRAGVYGPVDRGFPDDGIIVQGAPDEAGWVFTTLERHRLDTVRIDGAVRNHQDWPALPPACRIARLIP